MKNRYKIAILTLYYHNYNYGGLLQAYALQMVLSKAFGYADQISYQLRSGYSSQYPSFLLSFVEIGHFIKILPWRIKFRKTIKKMNKFANSISHTRVVTAKTISNLIHEYNIFVCGSDQIWNPVGWQPTLFLNFVPNSKIKISYAASIARDNLTTDQVEYIRKYVKDFSAISVREKKSADMLNRIYPQLDVQYMPDPVFLLEESEWKKFVRSKSSTETFIFGYFLGEDVVNREKALAFSKKLGIKIIFASHLSFSQYKWEKKHQNKICSPLGVEDFLNNIANASLVLTDSFHAAAFSAIYRTPFYVLPRFSLHDKNSMNSRIFDLVEELHIPNRFTENLNEDFEWTVEEKENLSANINRLRIRGIQYLEKSLCVTKGV